MGAIGSSGLGAGIAGIQRGLQQVAGAASKISSGGVEPDALIDMKMGGVAVRASVAATRSVDESLGHLLDLLA